MIYLALGFLLVVLAVSPVIAQKPIMHIVINQHDTIEFTVEQMKADRYTWDIFTDPYLNFANDEGSLDRNAHFVDGMYEGTTVRITNLNPGRYFIRVMAWDEVHCTNNLMLYILDVLEVPEVDLFGDEACFGDNTYLRIIITGIGPWEVIYTDGIESHTVNINGTAGQELMVPITPPPIETKEYWITYIKDLGTGSENFTPTEKAKIIIHQLPENTKIYPVTN